MYNKYDDNKHKILQHITVVEGSLNKEEVKMKRLNCLVKEKQKHDKVNGEV